MAVLEQAPPFAGLSEEEVQRFEGLGKLELSTESARLTDDAGHEVLYDLLFTTEFLHEAIQIARELRLGIIIIGALTSATRNFQIPENSTSDLRGVIAIRPKSLMPNTDESTQIETEGSSRRIQINHDRLGPGQHTITIGVGVTITQAQQVVKEKFKGRYYIPLDHTTVDSAYAGGVYATGAQGPSRIMPSDMVTRVVISTGEETPLEILDPEQIKAHEGLLGLNGGVIELEVKLLERPPHRFGMFLYLRSKTGQSDHDRIAEALVHLAPYTDLSWEEGRLHSRGKDGVIDGIEILTKEDLERLGMHKGATSDWANERVEAMEKEGSQIALYVTGNLHHNLYGDSINEDFMPILCNLEEKGIVSLDGSSMIESELELESARLGREAVTLNARSAAKNADGRNVFSQSTDVNMVVNTSELGRLGIEEQIAVIKAALEPYTSYIADLHSYREKEKIEASGIRLSVYEYGHALPRGMNPHVRAIVEEIGSKDTNVKETRSAEEKEKFEAIFEEVRTFVKKRLEKLFADLREVAEEYSESLTLQYGEKGKVTPDSWKLLSPEQRASALAAILAAGPNFNFRTPNHVRSAA